MFPIKMSAFGLSWQSAFLYQALTERTERGVTTLERRPASSSLLAVLGGEMQVQLAGWPGLPEQGQQPLLGCLAEAQTF